MQVRISLRSPFTRIRQPKAFSLQQKENRDNPGRGFRPFEILDRERCKTMLLRFLIHLAWVWSRLVDQPWSASVSSPYLAGFELALDLAARRLFSRTRCSPLCRNVVFLFSSSLLCSASFADISPPFSFSLFLSSLSCHFYVQLRVGSGKIHDEQFSTSQFHFARPSCISLYSPTDFSNRFILSLSFFTCVLRRVILSWAGFFDLFFIGRYEIVGMKMLYEKNARLNGTLRFWRNEKLIQLLYLYFLI